MYLSDREIRSRLPELSLTTSNPEHPFSVEVQVQPSSIDLRVDSVFWKSKLRHFGRRGAVDLRRRKFNEAAPRRGWTEFTLKEGETFKLKPGQLLLARTYERFHLPRDLAGQIAARSSYSRMGLLVHCGGDFINPGWNGHMPLQLVNLSRRTVRVTAYLPIAQLMLVPLSSPPLRQYNDVGLRNKYADDDGGPSYWWRDRLMEVLSSKFDSGGLPDALAEPLGRLLATNELDEDVVSRLEAFVDKQTQQSLSSWTDLIDRFVRTEDRRTAISTWLRRAPYGAFVLFFGWLLSLLTMPWGAFSWTAAIVSGVSVMGVIVDRASRPNQKLTRKELSRLRAKAPNEF